MQNVSVFTRLKEAEANGATREDLLEIFNSDAKLSIMNKKVFMTWLDEERPLQYEHRYTLDKFTKEPLNFEGDTKSYVLIGATGIGKTQWAMAHFKNPAIVTNKSSLANISTRNDGIVFDDYSFTMCNPDTVLHYADTEIEKTHDVKYGKVTIGRGVPRIFCLNSEDQFFPSNCAEEQKAAIKRRVCIINLGSEQLFKGVPAFKSRDSLIGKRFNDYDEYSEAVKRASLGLAPIFRALSTSSLGSRNDQGSMQPDTPEGFATDADGNITEEEFEQLQSQL